MDAAAAGALFEYIATAAVCRPPGPLPRLFPAAFDPAEDAQIVSDGIARARAQLAARERHERAQRVLAQLDAAASAETGGALEPQTMGLITRTLRERPELVRDIPLDADHIRMYAKNCWSVLEAIIDIAEGPQEANRIIQCSVARPMSVVEHNCLAQLLINKAAAISAETLFVYLDAVEASCRQQPATGGAQVHNVRLAAKVFNSALDANAALAEAMSIELCSFCLSYTRVKDATDLYRRVLSAHSCPASPVPSST
ncbi:hypothetical protein LPJ61_004093 [Coemansia biformis]|uniref:CCR4-NOT transcription complex subunit 11 n=1 Tax=Coemansia biformis TaxID=1286918 RepID=A0A9W7YA68_9FUNG|nr:hypothetical protein LPJ61_004093 [Coemansia biformis]